MNSRQKERKTENVN